MNGFVIGSQKAGTSTVHEVLTAAGAATPALKETQFFADDARFAHGAAWYDQQFVGGGPRVEVDPAYLVAPDAPRRIRAAFGENIHYAVILRDPYDRAHSHYRMMVARGVENRSLVEALQAEIDQPTPLPYPQSARHGYLGSSRYLTHLAHWQSVLPNAQRLVLDFDRLISNDDHDSWNQLTDFLGVPARIAGPLPTANRAFTPRSLALNRFLFDRESFAGLRRVVHAVVPAGVRSGAADMLYRRNRTAAPAANDDHDGRAVAAERAARRLVADNVGYGRAEIESLLGPVGWATFNCASG